MQQPMAGILDAYALAARITWDLTEVCGPVAELGTLDGWQNLIDTIWLGRPVLPKNLFYYGRNLGCE